jgi:Fe2+ or Zn2+ uptake regulation protein
MLYETLRGCTTHPTAEELYRMLAASECGAGGMSRATVYNTLETLCCAGLVRRLPTASGCCRFDGDISDHLHMRLGDSEIVDVPPHLGQRLIAGMPREAIDAIEREMGVKVADVNIQLIASKTP